MNPTIDEQIRKELDAINTHLGSINEHMAWMIKSDSRFQIGERVEWSRKGLEAGFPSRKKAKLGIVKGISGFSVLVKLDGLKQPRSYHHSFFNPINGPKLF